METTIMGYIGYILGLLLGVIYWDTGKENGNYYIIIGYILHGVILSSVFLSG